MTLPDYRDQVIVVGTSVRKNLPTLKAYLDSLAWQELPPRTRLLPAFVPDFAPDQQDSQQFLFEWVNKRGGVLIQGAPQQGPDFSDAPGLDSHQWSQSSMARVGHNKNLILKYALETKADYVLLCDADLVLDKTVIASLLSAEKPITTAVYWTRWSRRGDENLEIHAAPQVWLRHPYELNGRGMDEAEFRQRLLSRSLLRVWGFGACTLIARRVLEAGVGFDYLPDVPQQGLMAGEDRHFCIRAERLHIDAYADNWSDIFHVYHADDDPQKIPEMAERLGLAHPESPALGDLVSLRLRPLEPLPVGPGRFQQSPPLTVRGRLGKLDLLPEIEEALFGMKRGEKQVVRVHFPVHVPAPYLRGRTRLIEVTLFDCKPLCYPPVLEDELYVGAHTGSPIDHTAITNDQHLSIRELAGV